MTEIQITTAHQRLFDIVLEATEGDEQIHDMLYSGTRAGKSYAAPKRESKDKKLSEFYKQCMECRKNA